jgi:hypothetical protein
MPQVEKPVYRRFQIIGGPHKGRIGDFDDTEEKKAIVYLGDMMIASGYYMIPMRNLGIVTTDALMTRRDSIIQTIALGRPGQGPLARNNPTGLQRHLEYFEELAYIENLLMDRLFRAVCPEPTKARGSSSLTPRRTEPLLHSCPSISQAQVIVRGWTSGRSAWANRSPRGLPTGCRIVITWSWSFPKTR